MRLFEDKGSLYPIHAIWLSLLLTVAHPSSAQGGNAASSNIESAARCTKLLFGEHATPTTITEFIGKDGLSIELPSPQNQPKSVFLAPVDSWARGENAKQLFVLAMRVESNEDGLNLFNQLIATTNAMRNTRWAIVTQKENVFEIPGICTARVHPPYYTRQIPMAQGSVELEIAIEKSADEVAVAAQIGAVLLKDFRLRNRPTSLQHLTKYDLSTFEGRAAWGFEAFHKWLESLSRDARTALRLISGPEYRDILPFLRGNGRNGYSSITTSQLNRLIGELDAAIDRGKIPVPVKVYRASADPHALEAWTQLSADQNAKVKQLSDAAYTFTSLDEDFVRAWNRNELRGKGIIIEIQASAGVKAGYVDRGPHERDYAEIIFARGQTLTPVRAYRDASGLKLLVVTAP